MRRAAVVIAGRVAGANLDEVRRHNLSTVLGYVHRHGATTRAELTTITGLNRSTIGDLVADLRERGLVVEGAAVSRGGPGRPSPLVLPAGDRVAVLALEIDVDSIAAAVVGIGGAPISRVRVERAEDDPAGVVAAIAELARRQLAELSPDTRLLAVGVAVAAVTRRRDGLVHFGPHLGWREVPLGALLATALAPGVTIRVGNDGDLGALAEHTRGAAVGVDDLVYLAGGAGVGGGIVTAGVPLHGTTGHAGEIGHVLVNPDGVDCRCGATGCWETETGELALLRHAGRSTDGGRAAVGDVLGAAAAGDEAALDAVRETGRWLGLGIGGLMNAFNPAVIVLGGFFAALHEVAAGVIEEAAGVQATDVARAAARIVPSLLGAESSLFGAAELAFEETLRDPASVPAVVGSR